MNIKYKDIKDKIEQIDAVYTLYNTNNENFEKKVSKLSPAELIDLRYLLITQWIADFEGSKYEIIPKIEFLLPYIVDSEIRFLYNCSNDELLFLTNWLIYEEEDEKEKKITKRSRESISGTAAFKSYYPSQLHKILPLIVNELLEFGSNVLSSRETYRGILIKVCDEFEVNYHPLITTQCLECELLKKVWDLPLKKLTLEDINQISIEKTRSISRTMDGIWSRASYRVIIPCVLIIAFYRLTALFEDEVYQKYLSEV